MDLTRIWHETDKGHRSSWAEASGWGGAFLVLLFLSLALRFWNQILTWISWSESDVAKCLRRVSLKYGLESNSARRVASWLGSKLVRVRFSADATDFWSEATLDFRCFRGPEEFIRINIFLYRKLRTFILCSWRVIVIYFLKPFFWLVLPLAPKLRFLFKAFTLRVGRHVPLWGSWFRTATLWRKKVRE